MKTGIELIAQERKEQIEKHGFTPESDMLYVNDELVQASKCCEEKVGRGVGFTNIKHPWPKGWSRHHADTIRAKSDIGKLIVAGAFLLADDDRRYNSGADRIHHSEINRIATEIDRLRNSQTS